MENIKTAPNTIKQKLLSDSGSAFYYQSHDAEVVDYKLWELWTPKTGFVVRGPRPANLTPKTFCTSIGAAFTFGRFVANPYPELLGKALGIGSLNLGFAGIGPVFFNYPKNKILIDLINQSKFVTVCVMSGRSQSNSRFKAEEHSQVEYRLPNNQIIPADFAYQQLLEEADEATIKALVAETRERYLAEFIQLLNSITVPKVLLWFSKRSPDYTESYDTSFTLFNSFPHLVNQSMADTLRSHCDEYVECISTEGLPQALVSRHTQEPVSIVRPRTYRNGKVQLIPSTISENRYYPSPEMHYAVAKKLLPVCQRLSV